MSSIKCNLCDFDISLNSTDNIKCLKCENLTHLSCINLSDRQFPEKFECKSCKKTQPLLSTDSKSSSPLTTSLSLVFYPPPTSPITSSSDSVEFQSPLIRNKRSRTPPSSPLNPNSKFPCRSLDQSTTMHNGDGTSISNQNDTVTLADIMNKLHSIEASISNINQTNRTTVNGIIQSILSRDAFSILLDPCEILITGLPTVQGADLERAIMAILNACGCSEFYRTIVSKRAWLPNGNRSSTQSLYSVVIRVCSNSARDAIISKAPALRNVNAGRIFGTNANNRVYLNAIWPKETYSLLRKAQQVTKSCNLPPPVVRNLIVCIRASSKDTLIPIYNESGLNICTSSFVADTSVNMNVDRDSVPVYTTCNQQSQLTALSYTSGAIPQRYTSPSISVPTSQSLPYQQPLSQLNIDTTDLSLHQQAPSQQRFPQQQFTSHALSQSLSTPLATTTIAGNSSNSSAPIVFSPYSLIQPTPRASTSNRRVPPLRLQRQNQNQHLTVISNPLSLSATPTIPLQTIPDVGLATSSAASNDNIFMSNPINNNNNKNNVA